MAEILGANPQEHGASDGIPTEEIVKRISSIEEPRGRVEATRFSLQYLLAKGRPLDSLLLLGQMDAKNLPFNPEERDKMLNGILKTAEGLRKEDPIQAWDTIWGITYSKAKRAAYERSGDFTREEYERLNTQEFKDQQAATLARYIECYLNPDIEIKGRERFARRDLSSDMNDTTGVLYHLDFGKVFDFLDKATREKLLAIDRDHPLNVLKSRLQKEGETARPQEKSAEETEEIGEISSFTNRSIYWVNGNCTIDIDKRDDGSWYIYFNVNDKREYARGETRETFNLETAIKNLKDIKGIEPGTAEKIYQSLAKGFLDPSDKSISSVLSKYLPVDMYMVYSANDRRRFILNPDGTLGNPYNNESYTLDHLGNPDMFEPRFADRLKSTVGKSLLETWIKGSPPTPAKSDSAPAAETPAKIEQPELTAISTKTFTLGDGPFSGMSPEAINDIIAGTITGAGGEYNG